VVSSKKLQTMKIGSEIGKAYKTLRTFYCQIDWLPQTLFCFLGPNMLTFDRAHYSSLLSS